MTRGKGAHAAGTCSLPAGDAMGALRGRTVLSVIVGHLASAPRAQKEARALRSAGAEVIIRGNWYDPSLVDEDRALAAELDVDFAPATDLRRLGGHMVDRWRHRLAREAQRIGLRSPRVLGPGAPELLRAARRINADLTVVHSEAALWVGRALLQDGRRVAVDFEDWFSHDQLPEDRSPSVRAALEVLERHLLVKAHACLATTHVMAEALAAHGHASRVPTVVRNCFPALAAGQDWPGAPDVVDPAVVSFYWFSQTIGPGRGLETLARALALVRGEWQLTLRGALDRHRAWFEVTFSPEVRKRIRCVAPVSNAHLPARTRSHDVGLALEVPYCLNKELTASNKIHEYLRAGLAVIATDTRGQAEVMHASGGAGELVAPGDVDALAVAMQCMLDDPAHRAACRAHAAQAGATTWDWARQEPALLHALAGALA
jgi:glycosyltransferase involved in cell wall biosynthesis